MERDVLNLVRLPARLDAQQTARLLGFHEHDLPILIKSKLLAPLGRPSSNSPKWYCTAELLELSKDRSWLDKATKAVTSRWKEKNERSKEKQLNGVMFK